MTFEQEAAIFEAAVESNRPMIDRMAERDRDAYVNGLSDGVAYAARAAVG